MRIDRKKQEYIQDNFTAEIDEALVQKLPMLIRKDGLEKTLQFLKKESQNNKKEGKDTKQKNKVSLYDFFYGYIKENYINILKEEEKRTEERSYKEIVKEQSYMYVTKEIYDLSVILKSTYGRLKYESKEEESQGEELENNLDLSIKEYDKKQNWEKENTSDKGVLRYRNAKIKSSQFYSQLYKKSLSIPVKTIGSMVVGLGDVSVDEVSITKHHLMDIPYIPATSIKGVFRHYCEEIKLCDKKLEDWFGSENKQGKLIFTDSYPSQYTLKTDVMTPHYTTYYLGGDSKTIVANAIPVTFPVICDAKFKIQIYTDSENVLLEEVEKMLKECIVYKTFGAKGAVGYGELREDK